MEVGVQSHAPAASTSGKDPVPIVQEAGWAPGPVWTSAPTGILRKTYIHIYVHTHTHTHKHTHTQTHTHTNTHTNTHTYTQTHTHTHTHRHTHTHTQVPLCFSSVLLSGEVLRHMVELHDLVKFILLCLRTTFNRQSTPTVLLFKSKVLWSRYQPLWS